MNLDLNLGPVVQPPQDEHPNNISFGDWLHGSMREEVSNPPTASHQLPPVWRHIPVPMEAGNIPLGLTAGSAAATAANKDERPPKLMKTNENGDKSLEKGDEGSFFDCNICLDLASEPVVTCCGHLFCWPCIYRWLFVHSHAKECPICKGEVTIKKITPIYSRANCKHITKVVDQNSSAKIPSRPLANRIESWRQSFQRNTINIPMFEMIRSLDNNRFHLTRDPISNNPQEIPSTLLLNRIFTSRGIRRARDTVPATSPDAMLDLPNWDVNIPNLTSAESFVESYFRDRPDERNQEELPLIDRHSMSSVTDIIWSEIPTTGTGSRRRCESSTSRVLDVDGGNSHSRRRLH